MLDNFNLVDYFIDINFIVGCVITFIIGCVGSGILLFVIKRNPNLKYKFNISVGEGGSKWDIVTHVIIGGVLSLVISWGHLANPIQRSPIILAEGAAWPAIFIGMVETRALIRTSEELKRIEELLISTMRKGNGEGEGDS